MFLYASVAQLDRASVFGTECWGFKFLRSHQKIEERGGKVEKLDLYDIEGNLLGKTIFRGEKPNEGEFIKLAVVYLKSENKFLFQKCSEEKGSEYAVTGGHVQAGLTSKEQAIVEVKEELGIDIDAQKLQFVGNINRGKAIFDVYLYEDCSLQNVEFVLQEEEVESVCWLTKTEIEELISQGVVRASSCQHYEKFFK